MTKKEFLKKADELGIIYTDAFVKNFKKAHPEIPEIEVCDDIIKLIFKEARTVEEDEYEYYDEDEEMEEN